MFSASRFSILSIASIVALSSSGISATSANAEELADASYQSLLTVPFDHGVSLEDALEIATSGIVADPVGLRIDNGEVVGEYYFSSGQTAESALTQFKQRFGTEPRIVGLVIDSQTSSEGSLKTRSTDRSSAVAEEAVIETNAAEFTPAPVTESARDGLLKHRTGIPKRTTRAVQNWGPEQVWSATYRSGTHQYVEMSMSWYNSVPQNIPGEFGFEAEVNLYNSDSTGIRPFGCTPGYRDRFIAKNYGWYGWYAFASTGNISSAQPYQDSNDLSDACNINSMAIGFRFPQNIPATPGDGVEVNTFIDAPIGTYYTSKVGGLLQQVSNVACPPFGASLTDCMGLIQLSGDSRTTLNVARNYWASPNLGWLSNNWGLWGDPEVYIW